MNLQDALKNGIGKRIVIYLDSMYINMPSKHFTSYQDNIYISLSSPDWQESFHIKSRPYDFEDEFESPNPDEVGEKPEISYTTETKYSITAEKIKHVVCERLPIQLTNNYFEITSVEVYHKKIGLKREDYNLLNKKYNFCPELYIIKFRNEEEILIYYNIWGPQKNIFYSRKDFIDEITTSHLKLTDFEAVDL
jgi:hypothetical protein